MTIEQGLYQIGKELHEIRNELERRNKIGHALLVQITSSKIIQDHQNTYQTLSDGDRNGQKEKGINHVD